MWKEMCEGAKEVSAVVSAALSNQTSGVAFTGASYHPRLLDSRIESVENLAKVQQPCKVAFVGLEVVAILGGAGAGGRDEAVGGGGAVGGLSSSSDLLLLVKQPAADEEETSLADVSDSFSMFGLPNGDSQLRPPPDMHVRGGFARGGKSGPLVLLAVHNEIYSIQPQIAGKGNGILLKDVTVLPPAQRTEGLACVVACLRNLVTVIDGKGREKEKERQEAIERRRHELAQLHHLDLNSEGMGGGGREGDWSLLGGGSSTGILGTTASALTATTAAVAVASATTNSLFAGADVTAMPAFQEFLGSNACGGLARKSDVDTSSMIISNSSEESKEGSIIGGGNGNYFTQASAASVRSGREFSLAASEEQALLPSREGSYTNAYMTQLNSPAQGGSSTNPQHVPQQPTVGASHSSSLVGLLDAIGGQQQEQRGQHPILGDTSVVRSVSASPAPNHPSSYFSNTAPALNVVRSASQASVNLAKPKTVVVDPKKITTLSQHQTTLKSFFSSSSTKKSTITTSSTNATTATTTTAAANVTTPLLQINNINDNDNINTVNSSQQQQHTSSYAGVSGGAPPPSSQPPLPKRTVLFPSSSRSTASLPHQPSAMITSSFSSTSAIGLNEAVDVVPNERKEVFPSSTCGEKKDKETCAAVNALSDTSSDDDDEVEVILADAKGTQTGTRGDEHQPPQTSASVVPTSVDKPEAATTILNTGNIAAPDEGGSSGKPKQSLFATMERLKAQLMQQQQQNAHNVSEDEVGRFSSTITDSNTNTNRNSLTLNHSAPEEEGGIASAKKKNTANLMSLFAKKKRAHEEASASASRAASLAPNCVHVAPAATSSTFSDCSPIAAAAGSIHTGPPQQGGSATPASVPETVAGLNTDKEEVSIETRTFTIPSSSSSSSSFFNDSATPAGIPARPPATLGGFPGMPPSPPPPLSSTLASPPPPPLFHEPTAPRASAVPTGVGEGGEPAPKLLRTETLPPLQVQSKNPRNTDADDYNNRSDKINQQQNTFAIEEEEGAKKASAAAAGFLKETGIKETLVGASSFLEMFTGGGIRGMLDRGGGGIGGTAAMMASGFGFGAVASPDPLAAFPPSSSSLTSPPARISILSSKVNGNINTVNPAPSAADPFAVNDDDNFASPQPQLSINGNTNTAGFILSPSPTTGLGGGARSMPLLHPHLHSSQQNLTPMMPSPIAPYAATHASSNPANQQQQHQKAVLNRSVPYRGGGGGGEGVQVMSSGPSQSYLSNQNNNGRTVAYSAANVRGGGGGTSYYGGEQQVGNSNNNDDNHNNNNTSTYNDYANAPKIPQQASFATPSATSITRAPVMGRFKPPAQRAPPPPPRDTPSAFTTSSSVPSLYGESSHQQYPTHDEGSPHTIRGRGGVGLPRGGRGGGWGRGDTAENEDNDDGSFRYEGERTNYSSANSRARGGRGGYINSGIDAPSDEANGLPLPPMPRGRDYGASFAASTGRSLPDNLNPPRPPTTYASNSTTSCTTTTDYNLGNSAAFNISTAYGGASETVGVEGFGLTGGFFGGGGVGFAPSGIDIGMGVPTVNEAVLQRLGIGSPSPPPSSSFSSSPTTASGMGPMPDHNKPIATTPTTATSASSSDPFAIADDGFGSGF